MDQDKNRGQTRVFSRAPSRHQGTNPCRVFEACQSCSLLNLEYKFQVLEKTDQVRRYFDHYTIQHFVLSPDRFSYKHAIKLVISAHFVRGQRWVDVGFYRKSLEKVVDIGNCPIQHNRMNDVIHHTRIFLKNNGVTIYNPTRKSGMLSGMILRISRTTQQILVTFLVKDVDVTAMKPMARYLMEACSSIEGVFLEADASTRHGGPPVLSEPQLVAGKSWIEESFLGTKFKLAPGVEIPPHPEMTARMYARVLELCDEPDKTALYLYADFGPLVCLLAKSMRHVVALHTKKAVLDNVEANTAAQDVHNVSCQLGPVSQSLHNLHTSPGSAFGPTVAVISAPPRFSLGAAEVEALGLLRPHSLVYLSAFEGEKIQQDADAFAKIGYRLKFLEPYDTQPGTSYFDVLCYFDRQPEVSPAP